MTQIICLHEFALNESSEFVRNKGRYFPGFSHMCQGGAKCPFIRSWGIDGEHSYRAHNLPSLQGKMCNGPLASAPQVNLDSCTREETSRNMLEPTITCFDEAQRKIFNLMEKDSYRRFLKYRFYLDLVNLSSCGSEKQKGAKSSTDCASLVPQCA